MKVSIITPTYNSEKYLREAILSVLDQGHDVEHLVVDGASTDGTVALVRQFDHIKWVSEPDSGMTEALNKALDMATGDVIGWLNSDDRYEGSALRHVLDAFTTDPSADVIYGSFNYMTESGQYVRTVRNTPFSAHMMYFYGCYVPSTAAFWRRRIAQEGHRFDETFRIAMDYEYFMRLASKGYRFRHVPEVLASFRLRQDNVGNRLSEHLFPEQQLIWRRYRADYNPLRIPFRAKPLTRNAFRGLRILWKALNAR